MTRTLPSFEDATRVIQSLRHPYVKDVALVVLHSGIRLSECLALRRQDVDLQHSMICVPHRGPNEIVIRIDKTVKSILEERLSPDEFLFIGKRGHPLTASHCSCVFRRAARDIGIDVTIHDLRRIYVQFLFRQGLSLIVVSQITGTSLPHIRRYASQELELSRRM